VQYTPTQYDYNPANATNKFIRMHLNNGILPLNTIRGGMCGTAASGRVNVLCAMQDFIASQANAYVESSYNYACFGNYTVKNATRGFDYDGAVFANSTSVNHI
jgi:hypothetical protein